MESEEVESVILQRYIVETKQTVREYLQSKKLRVEMFSVLIDGISLAENDEIDEGDEIILIPKVAGGV